MEKQTITTQDQKIKELQNIIFNCQHGDDDEFLDTEYLIELFLDWHYNEIEKLVKKMQTQKGKLFLNGYKRGKEALN